MAVLVRTSLHVCVALLLTLSSGLDARSLQQVFLKDIVSVYGANGSLEVGDIDELLETIVEEKPFGPSSPYAQCLSSREILAHYGLQNRTHLAEEHLVTICPALLNQAVLPPCPTRFPGLDNIDPAVWGYGFLAVTIINLAALLGLALVPITKKPYFPKVLTYFIGLAVGTLFSNAALQLIPEAFGFDPKTDSYVLQAFGIFCGFYLLYCTEKILKMVLKTEHENEHGHSHFPPAESVQQNGAPNTPAFSISDKVSMTSDSSVEQNSCRWLRGRQLANIKTVAWMITLSDALHNFIDGLTIGASFTVSILAGFSTSIAIICEELPHELGDFVILLNAGMSVPQALFFNMMSAMSCYIGLFLGILLGSAFAPNIIFAFAGGMFLYIALADMLPEMELIAREQPKGTKNEMVFFALQNAGLLTGFTVILLITLFAGDINLG